MFLWSNRFLDSQSNNELEHTDGKIFLKEAAEGAESRQKSARAQKQSRFSIWQLFYSNR